MVRVLKRFNFKSRANSRHPWDKWLDGRIWAPHRDKDYTCEPAALRSAAHAAANKRGAIVRTSIAGDVVTPQATPKVKP